ncbi:MAG: hypothetical protein QM831_32485 [Kofleriaceae bacterium]
MTQIPDWLVERAALDEVPPNSRSRLDGVDATELAARVAQLETQNRDELAKYPAAAAVKQIDQNAAAERISRKRRKRFVLATVTTTVTLAVAALVMFHTTDRGQKPSDEITRVKGTARLLAFRQGDHVVEKLENDATVKPGDTIQLRYNSGGARYGMIASVDGNAVVTLHFPASETAPTEMAHDTTTLPDAYTLDDAPKFERFFIFTSDQPIDVSAALSMLRDFAHHDDAADAMPEIANVHTAAFRLKKGTP